MSLKTREINATLSYIISKKIVKCNTGSFHFNFLSLPVLILLILKLDFAISNWEKFNESINLSNYFILIQNFNKINFTDLINMSNRTVETVVREEIIKADGTKVVKVTKTYNVHENPVLITSENKNQDISKENSSSSPSNHPNDEDVSSGNEFTKFQEECLLKHNQLRLKHGVGPLKLSKDLSNYAQEWADHLIQANVLKHRSNNSFGENLYMKGSSNLQINGGEAVDSWYNEIAHYSFANPGFKSGTGHFTQVVWKDSKRLGVGVAIKNNRCFVVANYDPPGNVMGRFRDNVFPPKN